MEEKYLKLVLKLAKKGSGYTNPNPLVGAVIVKDEKVIGKGYHQGYGLPHAEINALREAGKKANGATLHVNLEPCCFFGKTPPCTDAIIKAGIKKVVISMKDPNPKVSGRGINQLKRAGIKIKTGILEEEAKKLNESYVKYITQKIPFVTLKAAMSLDGKIATRNGKSKWITSKTARDFSHRSRFQYDGILAGIGTVLKDNPSLDYFPPGNFKKGIKKFTKIIVDGSAKIPLSANLFRKSKVILATTKMAPINKLEKLKKKGAEILVLGKDGKVNLLWLMKELGKRGISNLLIEGGGQVNESALRCKIVDKICFFIAPKIIGGESAKTPVEGEGIKNLKEAILIKGLEYQRIGEDILVEGYIKKSLELKV